MKPNHKIFLIISCFLLVCFSKSHAAIYYITSTDTAGGLQLNNAITQANSDSLKDTIYFNIPGAGPFNVTLIYPVPVITKPLLIDGLSQPGNDTTLWLIRLTGNAGFKISSSYCTMRGLRMFGAMFYTGPAILIQLTAGVLDSLTFEQNYIEHYVTLIDLDGNVSVWGLALDHLTIRDNKFINSTHGIELEPTDYNRYMKHLKLVRNNFNNTFCMVGGTKPHRKAYYTIADNFFQYSGLGLDAHMNIVNVVRNHFFDQSKLMGYISLDSLVISDNYFDSITGNIQISCVDLRIKGTENQKLYFERNNLYQYNCGGLDISMHDIGNDSASIDGIFIRNNHFQNSGGWGIDLGYASSSSNNIIKNVFIDSNNFIGCLGVLLCLEGLQGSRMSNIEIAENNIDLVQLNNGINPLINMWMMSGTMDSIVIRNNILNGSGIEYETSGSNLNNAKRIYISNNQITNSTIRPAILFYVTRGKIEDFSIDSNEISSSITGISFFNYAGNTIPRFNVST